MACAALRSLDATTLGHGLRLRLIGPRLGLIDVNYPADGNRFGNWATALRKRVGDLIRDLHALFAEFGLGASDGRSWGSVHLDVAARTSLPAAAKVCFTGPAWEAGWRLAGAPPAFRRSASRGAG